MISVYEPRSWAISWLSGVDDNRFVLMGLVAEENNKRQSLPPLDVTPFRSQKIKIKKKLQWPVQIDYDPQRLFGWSSLCETEGPTLLFALCFKHDERITELVNRSASGRVVKLQGSLIASAEIVGGWGDLVRSSQFHGSKWPTSRPLDVWHYKMPSRCPN